MRIQHVALVNPRCVGQSGPSLLNQQARVAAMLGIQSDTDMVLDIQSEIFALEWFGQAVMDLLGDKNRVFGTVNGRQQYTDLAVFQSDDSIGISQGNSQPCPNLLGKMVGNIAKVLGLVEIDEQHSDLPGAVLGRQDRVSDWQLKDRVAR